jgi:hypothetical protein
MKKSVSIALLGIILLQSCAAYNKRPVRLNEAAYRGKVRVIYKSGEGFKYDFISTDDNNYFGVKGKNKTQIDSVQIWSVHLKKKNKSIAPTDGVAGGVLIVVLIGAGVLFVWALVKFFNFIDNL